MNKSSSGAFKLVCVLFSAAALVLSLLGSVRAAALSGEIEELEEALKLSKEENGRLLLDMESSIGLAELERYAVEVLGMQTPSAGQMIHIDHVG